MPDYYARLEAQLADLTERGAHQRRRVGSARPGLPGRAEFLVVAASLAVAVTLAIAFLSIGNVRHPRHISPATHIPRVLRNIYPAPLPAPTGSFICESPIVSPGRHPSARGEVRFYGSPPADTGMFISATGLRPPAGRSTYAVWLLPAVMNLTGGYQLQSTARPELLGVVKRSTGTAGRLRVAAVLAAHFNGAYKVLITVQPGTSTRAPGHVALSGFVDF